MIIEFLNPGTLLRTGILGFEDAKSGFWVGMCRIRFFNFGSVSVRFLKKNSDSVRNEFFSIRFAKTLFGSDNYLLLM